MLQGRFQLKHFQMSDSKAYISLSLSQCPYLLTFYILTCISLPIYLHSSLLTQDYLHLYLYPFLFICISLLVYLDLYLPIHISTHIPSLLSMQSSVSHLFISAAPTVMRLGPARSWSSSATSSVLAAAHHNLQRQQAHPNRPPQPPPRQKRRRSPARQRKREVGLKNKVR